jgi:hypothetical protein
VLSPRLFHHQRARAPVTLLPSPNRDKALCARARDTRTHNRQRQVVLLSLAPCVGGQSAPCARPPCPKAIYCAVVIRLPVPQPLWSRREELTRPPSSR